ncbi:MAG: hypothetical protein JWP01_1719 [Myxococcales bacterium]|nr:hypothetical protein [Myxococcales bacterium]
MKSVAAGLLLVAVFVASVACGGAQKPAGWEERLVQHNQISNLWTQIRGWRHEAKMDLDPPAQLVQYLRGKTVRDAAKVCKGDKKESATCSDICSLADAICDNAESICAIADKLGAGDAFAQEKCTSAKASCREAKQRCCGCSDAAPTAGSSDTAPQGGLW